MKLITKKKAKEILKELMVEDMIAKAEVIFKRNEELEEQLALLSPSKSEDKKLTNYIG